ncbi:DUF202 domain-containing protein [Actinoplanes sp. NPDC051633]|uniref:DUF202 domain-containing protein n=1 Tax=Actinoplanes sp. NPDC051633 TaxID=3155670 RepID=UPI00342F4196
MTTDATAVAERTRLAWRRTGLSAAVVMLLAMRPAFADAGPAAVLLAVAAMGGWVTLVVTAYRRARGLTISPPRPGRRSVVAYAAITVSFAVIGGLVVTL